MGQLNVFWTVNGEMTNILFEAPDNAWTAFGFTPSLAAQGSMNSANVLFGCTDFPLDPPLLSGPYDAQLPAQGVIRNVSNVAGGFDAGNLLAEGAMINEARVDGICGVRFVRPNILVDPLIENQDLVLGTQTGVVWARGAIGSQATPGAHGITDRGFGLQDFIGDAGVITDNAITPIGATTVPGGTAAPDNSGSLASVSAMLSGAVAALTLALW